MFFFVRWDFEGRLKYLIFAYIACGVGILTKGPVALVVPWLAYIVWEVSKYLRQEKPLFFHLLWGPLIALAVAHTVQCPYCIDAYTQACLEKGSNPAEMTEAIHVATAIRGGSSLVHGVQMRNVAGKLSM